MNEASSGESDVGLVKRVVSRFEVHHDYTSAIRQRAIADLACLVNLAMLGLYFFVVGRWGWDLTISTAASIAIVSLWSMGFLGMILSSSIPSILKRMFNHLGEGPAFDDRDEPGWQSKWRKYLYYPSSYMTFTATAIAVEVSGGLVVSPFTSVFFTMILGAQQLSRYKLNSRIFICFGIAATLLLALYEQLIGIQSQPAPPAELTFYMLAFAILLTAMCTHAAKPVNYRARGVFPDPTHAELYLNPKDRRWRYSLYNRGTRLDTVIDGSPELNLGEAQGQVETSALGLCTGGEGHIEWRTYSDGTEVMGYIKQLSPSKPTGG